MNDTVHDRRHPNRSGLRVRVPDARRPKAMPSWHRATRRSAGTARRAARHLEGARFQHDLAAAPRGGQDRFLELNLTNETLVFTKINGAIPNRGC